MRLRLLPTFPYFFLACHRRPGDFIVTWLALRDFSSLCTNHPSTASFRTSKGGWYLRHKGQLHTYRYADGILRPNDISDRSERSQKMRGSLGKRSRLAVVMRVLVPDLD